MKIFKNASGILNLDAGQLEVALNLQACDIVRIGPMGVRAKALTVYEDLKKHMKFVKKFKQQ